MELTGAFKLAFFCFSSSSLSLLPVFYFTASFSLLLSSTKGGCPATGAVVGGNFGAAGTTSEGAASNSDPEFSPGW